VILSRQRLMFGSATTTSASSGGGRRRRSNDDDDDDDNNEYDDDDSDYDQYVVHSSYNMVLSRSTREDMLYEMGYTRSQIADAVRNNVRAKRERRRTVHNLRTMKFEEMVEGVAKSLRRTVLRRGSSSKKLYKNWKEQHEKLQMQQTVGNSCSSLSVG